MHHPRDITPMLPKFPVWVFSCSSVFDVNDGLIHQSVHQLLNQSKSQSPHAVCSGGKPVTFARFGASRIGRLYVYIFVFGGTTQPATVVRGLFAQEIREARD